jgi:hypothetical protein
MMYMGRLSIFLIILAAFTLAFASCGSAPEVAVEPVAVEEPPAPAPVVQSEAPAEPTPEPVPEPEPVFDPASITQEKKETTKAEIEKVIKELNQICLRKDFNSWLLWIDDGYKKTVSDPEYLAQLSDSPGLKSRKVTLTNIEDYFKYVFVESRRDARVDDIVFVSPTRVQVYRVDTRAVPENPDTEERLVNLGWEKDGKQLYRRVRFYTLEEVANDDWKISSTD